MGEGSAYRSAGCRTQDAGEMGRVMECDEEDVTCF